MSEMLTKYLKDFSQFVPAEEPASADFEMPDLSLESDWPPSSEPVVDIEDEKRKAFEEGEAAALQRLSETHAAELEALRSNQLQELEEQRLRFEEEIAGHLATAVIMMKQSVTQHVEGACLKLFSLFVERTLAERTASDLSLQILREIQGGYTGTIRISGPDHLLARIRDTVGDIDNSIDYEVSGDIDIQVQMDDSVLVTRLSEFFQSVKGLSDE